MIDELQFIEADRVGDRYVCEVASFAVLADTRPRRQPSRLQIERWGTRLGLVFPSVKLLSYVGPEAELEGDPKPFATVVLAP